MLFVFSGLVFGTCGPLAVNPTTGGLDCSGTGPAGPAGAAGTNGTNGVASSISVNSVNITTQSAPNFLNSAATNGLTLTFANPSAGGIQLGFTGTLNNTGLANPATTVNSQTCTLGSTCTVTVPISTGVSGLGTGCATFLATPSSANLRACITDETGTGLTYFQGGDIGTPSAGNASNLTNLPITLTTTGSSGASTYTQATNTLNIPQYAGGGGTPGGSTNDIQFNSAGSFAGGRCTMDSSQNISCTGGISTGVGGSVAGHEAYGQGTAFTAPTSSVGFQAPTLVTTKFMMTLPTAPLTGFMLNTGTTDPTVISYVASSGSGNVCLTTSCVMTTPQLGTPASGVMTNMTGLALAGTPLTTRGDILVVNSTPALARLAKGTQYQTLQGGASDTLFDAVHLDQATAITGNLPAANVASGALANGMTATTQSAGSNDTKVATDAYVDATKCTTTKTTGTTATLSTCFTVNQEATAAAGVTYTLPTAANGLQYCIDNDWNGSAATTGVLTFATSASGQFMTFTDGTLTATGGNVTSGGAARDGACVFGVDSTHWIFLPHAGVWTKH